MSKLSYTQFTQNQILTFGTAEPILIRNLGLEIAKEYELEKAKANAAAAVAVKRILETNSIPALRCFGKGIYYLTKQTVFGEIGINKEKLIEIKYLTNNNGYETGTALMHKIGLTSSMPAERTFVSNNAQNRTKKDNMLGITIKTPRTTITRDNQFYFQFLDLLNLYDDVPIDAEDPYLILNQFVQVRNLNYEKLLRLADLYYNYNTIIKLAHVASNKGASL